MGSRRRAQSPSSVNKTSQWQLACMFHHAHPAPRCGYKRRARENAQQFFAEEPRLCDPALQRWYSNYGDGTLCLCSLLQGTRVTQVTKTFLYQSVTFDITSVWLTNGIPWKMPQLLTPSSALQKLASPPHQLWWKIGQGLGRDDSHCCSVQWVG